MMTKEDDYFSHENTVFKEFIYQIKNYLNICSSENYDFIFSLDNNVFADATHLNKKSRAKVINEVKDCADEINVIWMKTPLEECLKRNARRTGLERVPDSVIKSMYNKIEEPTKEEGIDKIYIIDGITQKVSVKI